ncbi:hypothetical protein J2X16_000794 [Pelomonas aquatica]|uniref:Uncharacterized protein n=1 Tax=Pelomonas aquatica TaxID=431058 RepID=A0ABU1Z4C8_9BURK|nr:hypothetical protein [Pelomonas aquatica]MDR7295473.1 hypothetical protein [Pelomonas aquatica]
MNLFIERWYPLASGMAAALCWWWLCVPFPAPEAARDLYATTMSFAAISVGFLATAMSIIVAAPDSPLVRQLAQSGYLKDLVRYLREPFIVGILVAALCLSGFVLPVDPAKYWAFGTVWAALTVAMLLGLARIGFIFVKVITFIGQQSLKKRP